MSDEEQQQQQEEQKNTNNGTTTTVMKNDDDIDDDWKELMGRDLLLKTLPSPSPILDHPIPTSTYYDIQLHDIICMDLIGYYYYDTTRDENDTNDCTTLILNILQQHAAVTTTTTTKDTNHTNHNNNIKIFHSVQNMYCCIGDKDVIPAIEMGLRFLSVPIELVRNSNDNNDNDNTDNDNNQLSTTNPIMALIYSHSKYAYGLSTRTYTYTTKSTTTTTSTITNILPSQSYVMYKVIIKSVQTLDEINDETNLQLLLDLCTSKKLWANDIYQNDIVEVQSSSSSTSLRQESTTKHTTSNTTGSSSSINNTYHKGRALHIYQRTIEKLENKRIELQQQQQKEVELDDKHDDTEGNTHTEQQQEQRIQQQFIQKAKQIQIDCYNNISATYMKCHEYNKVKETCITLLQQYDIHNIKALYRVAKASIYDPSSSYDEVKASIHAIQEEIQYIQQQQQQQQQENNDDKRKVVNISKLQKDLYQLQKEYQTHYKQYQQQQQIISNNIKSKLQQQSKQSLPIPTPLTTVTTTTVTTTTATTSTATATKSVPITKNTIETITDTTKGTKNDATTTTTTTSSIPSGIKKYYNIVQLVLVCMVFAMIVLYISIYLYIQSSPPQQQQANVEL